MRSTQFRLVGSAVLLVAVLLIGLAAIPYFGVARLDREVRERQETLVSRNISIWVSDVEFALTAWTIWDEAIAKIDNAFDLEWTDRNIGRSLIGTSRTRFVMIINGRGDIVYTKTDDEFQGRPFFARGAQMIAADARPLIDSVRDKEKAGRPAGIPHPIAFSKIEVIGDEAVLLSASLFQPDFSTTVPQGTHAPILVSAIPIAGSLQEFLGNRFLLDDATMGPAVNVSEGRAKVEVASGPNGQAQALSWRPATPAHDLLRQSLPLAVAVILVLVVVCTVAARISRRAIVSLVEAERRMRHAATHDFLTGLANRSMVSPEFDRMSKTGEVAVVCLDLDGFKAINDRHGHAAGDALLKEVAARLKAACRAGDSVFRLGGDEFALLMSDVSPAKAELFCRQLCLEISQPYLIQEKPMVIGASFGLSVVPAGETSSDAAFRRADEALYRAKNTLRYTPPTPQPESDHVRRVG